MAEQRFTAKTLYLFGGLLIWAAHFMFVYSANAIACERGLEDVTIVGAGLIPLTIAIATVAALAAAGYVAAAAMSWRGPFTNEPHGDPTTSFLRQVTIVLTLLSMIAIVLSALPSFVVQPCA